MIFRRAGRSGILLVLVVANFYYLPGTTKSWPTLSNRDRWIAA